MKTNSSNSINFGAKFISNQSIQKYCSITKTYKPTKVSFVEFSPKDNNDIRSMSSILKMWDGELYARNVLSGMFMMQKRKTDFDELKFYAIVENNKNFENIIPENILGIVEVEPYGKETTLEYIQVDPNLSHNYYGYEEPRFRKVGTGIINALKEMYNKITLISTHSARPFYEENDFICIDSTQRKYQWKKD